MSDPEAEYLAAKEAFVAAHKRLSAAKAAMKPVWEARETAKQQARVELQVKAAEAFLSGAPKKEVCVLAGKSPNYGSFYGLFDDFWRALLSHEEIYHLNGDIHADGWERRVTERALARYRERRAAPGMSPMAEMEI